MIERIRRYPAVLALFAQLGAALLALAGLLLYAQVTGQRASLLALGLVQGLLAAALGHWSGLARWWLPLNALFVPGLLLLDGQSWPAGVWLGGLLLLALLNWNSLNERVPLYLSGHQTRGKLVELLGELPASFALVDLGCGFAGTLCQLGRRYPRAQLVGYETAPLVFLVAWLRCLPRRNCRVYFRSLWQAELAAFDAVYCFLSPVPMPALWAKARAEMRPGALLVSNSFDVPGVTAERVIEVDDWRRSRLLIWRPGGPSRG